MVRHHIGDAVTVVPADKDPLILSFQRYATVSQITDRGCMVRLDATMPPDQEFGPIPAERLLPGWKDEHGDWRRW